MEERRVIVDDEYMIQAAERIRTALDELNGILDAYIGLLAQISENVIQAGETAQALEVYRGYAGRLSGNLYMIGENTRRLAASYLSAIDEADQYLYG